MRRSVPLIVLLLASCGQPPNQNAEAPQLDVAHHPAGPEMVADAPSLRDANFAPAIAPASGPAVSPTAAPGVAFNYRYAFRLPADRIAGDARDVVWRYAGVRPLYDDGSQDPSAITRDYTLRVDDADGAAPVLSVFGGKITTYRRLAEAAMDELASYFPGLKPAWTAQAPLPGAPGGQAQSARSAALRVSVREVSDFKSDT